MARATTLTYTNELAVEACCACGMDFAMPLDWQERRRKEHGTFCCPAGHRQSYRGQSEEERLRERLEQTEQELANEATRAQRAERKAKKLENDLLDQVKERMTIEEKIHAGVCPYCNRNFSNVRRHMRSKHLSEKEREAEVASSKSA